MGKVELSRRQFIVTAAVAGGGMMLSLHLVGSASAAVPTGGRPWTGGSPSEGTEISAWLVIAPDNTVTIRCKQQEMGQGVFTSMAMFIAEGLECNWDDVSVEYGSANRNIREGNVYGNMGTAGSGAVRNNWSTLLLAGATAREMLKEAAAQAWGVPRSELTTAAGVVSHANGNSATFGELASAAVDVELAEEPAIKTPDQFTLVGQSQPRIEVPLKVDGSAVFGLDVRLPDMVYAATALSPVYGGRLIAINAEIEGAVRGMPGVVDVVTFGEENNPTGLRSGVAVVANTYWEARTALTRLQIEWDLGAGADVNSSDLRAGDVAALDAAEPGGVQSTEGDVFSVFEAAGDENIVTADYEAPYQAHAPMEPLNCTAQVSGDRVDVWMGTQNPSSALAAAAETAGVPPENVYVHNCFLGGGFGIRNRPAPTEEAVAIAMQLGGRPVKVVWSREDDISRCWFDPRQMIRFKAVVEDGVTSAFYLRATGDSIFGWINPAAIGGGFDFITQLGLGGMPYRFPNKQIEATIRQSHQPVYFHRAPGHNHNIFMLEGFIDEIAMAAGRDNVELRRELMSDLPNWVAVLDAAVENSDWGEETYPGFGRGIAIGQSFGSIVAAVAEVSVTRRGQLTVERVDVAVDCGNVVNPQTIRAQTESCVVYGLSSALMGEITFADGVVQQQNFNTYPVLRMADMPVVNTHLVPSGPDDNWGGIGEVTLPSSVAAVTNAIHAASGVRVRQLPVRRVDLSWG
ncbi:MAG: molybdopterin cofactor-binding domain-containing protein [Alphaproteobacteria bacterium]